MIVVAVVGTLFGAIAITSVWLATQDADDLHEMGVVLQYKNECVLPTAEQPAPKPHRTAQPTRSKRTRRPKPTQFYPAKHVHSA